VLLPKLGKSIIFAKQPTNYSYNTRWGSLTSRAALDYDVLDYCEKESTFRAMVNDQFGMPEIIRRFDLAGQLIDEELL